MIVRDATLLDALAIARVHVRSWQAAYRGVFADDFLDALRPEDRVGRYELDRTGRRDPRTVIAVEDRGDRDVLGFATIGRSRDADVAQAGELYALYVDPDAWGRGVARKLMARAYARFAELDVDLAILWVLSANERAQRFYRADGWSADGSERDEDVWNVPAHVVRYRRALPNG
jgi:ribosomal protein S18 acetylase RimI-like enzyme